MLSFRNALLHPQQPGDRLVEVKHAARFIRHQHAVLNGVKQRLKERTLAREPLNHRLQSLLVEPPDAPENLVEKTGFGRSHDVSVAGMRRARERLARMFHRPK